MDREGPARPLDGVVTALRPRRSPSWAESSKVARHALSPSAPPRGRPEPQAPDAGLRARISPSLSHRAERGPSPLSALCCGQQPHVGGLGRSAPCAPLGPGVPQPGPGSSVLHGGALGSRLAHCLSPRGRWVVLGPSAGHPDRAGAAHADRRGIGAPLHCTGLGEPAGRGLGLSAGLRPGLY